ncbi:Vacuolar membrane-associated protein IML1 [Hypsizygus marmoreus]|uniref:Vacuolar membrane-associated protein IML1 n=1 Tax=Hypsizygus marmoreus TaxID=39966 RepID=A0A369JLK7_HYPMA|nr:Vacuolar membrane-associated protein IML1 [Hypsizygus marmoreus]
MILPENINEQEILTCGAMTTSRAESLQSHYSRRRSNTAQSILRPTPAVPLKYGDSKVFNSWVHDIKESTNVIFNQSWWPGVAEGDLLQVKGSISEDPGAVFLFAVPKDDGCAKPQLQISIPKPVAEAFRLRNNFEVTVTKVDRASWCAEYVEFVFQDQYLGRNDMWRLGEHLVGQCIYTNQEITFVGNIAARIQAIYINGKTVSSACITASTKAVYRSQSAKMTIFIQVCRELWEFAGDGERFYEKIVHSFLPALFSKWRDANTNHIVTIVLISRVYYEESEIDYAAGPLRQDDSGKWYKDFFKVITDLEVIHDWKPTLVSLKDSFWDFQRDILLTHHYHQSIQDAATMGPPAQVRLIGRISYAHDGPILEAFNLALNPTETHYIDRSLSLTGATMILITPGTGFFRVSKDLLRLTTTRLLDQGFGIDLVSLTKPPLHQSPIFSFRSAEPKQETDGKISAQVVDPLWGAVEEDPVGEKKTFWWEPFWVSINFWDKQMDLPFRSDRFIGRAKMHQIQMLGLLELDVLSSIEVPYLPEPTNPSATPPREMLDDVAPSQAEADRFDMDTFALKPESKTVSLPRESLTPSGGSTAVTLFRNSDKRNSHRNSVMAGRIAPIEESPKRAHVELPPEELPSRGRGTVSFSELRTSPSRSSIRSLRSNLSTTSSKASETTPIRGSLASKLAPSWLFNPFRSAPSEPQTSPISASASSISHSPSANTTPTPTAATQISSPIRMPTTAKPSAAQISHSPLPAPIRHSTSTTRTSTGRTFEEDSLMPHRSSYVRRSPMGTPPRDEATFGKRRSGASLHGPSFTSSSSPSMAMSCNPSQPQSSVPHTQSSLARRWQHMYPQVLSKHEMKWKAMAIPVCLPLTVEHFPSASELELLYDVFSYDFVVDPSEMRSFLVKPPTVKGTSDEMRRAMALAVMRGMAAVRLAQGFQFILRSRQKDKAGLGGSDETINVNFRRTKSLLTEDELAPIPTGAADVLKSTVDPVYLSMTNEIHRISYTGEAIQVRRYVRRLPPSRPFKYQCLMWPKLGGGYTELSTTFSSHGLENYGWNRLDMLVAGYEHHFNESLRYWRTRFIVIPTTEPPSSLNGPTGEVLNDEEIRIIGIDKLAEQFTKLRWQPAEEKATHPAPPVRLLQTTLGPALCVRDAALMDQLDQIHAAGPLRKKIKSEREIGEMSLAAIAKAMREEDGVPIKNYHWHRSQYPNSFIGYDMVSWLVREFRDVSTRTQAAEWGLKLQEQGLFEHCRGYHSFLDGHYYYRLKGEYSIAMTPKGWFRRYAADDLTPRAGYYPSSVARPKNPSPRRNKKRIILSQSMVIDIDPNKAAKLAQKSDQAESVILHHDIIHNPGTVFHFELQWIGTTARCIEDLIRQWGRTIDRYGLRLVEAYVTQISDIRERNAFQSCYPLRLAIPPPIVMDLEKRVPEGTQTTHYFEYAILRKLGYIIDVEAASMYPEQIDVIYSYRRSPYKYSQFVHRSGMAFVQVLGGSQGFVFLMNRLMSPARMSKNFRPTVIAEELRAELQAFCEDKKTLQQFYDDELMVLRQFQLPEEPPPLSI